MDLNKLEEYRIDMQKILTLRQAKETVGEEKVVLICGGTGCHSASSEDIKKELVIKTQNMDNITVKQTGCFGFCAEGPIVQIYPDDVFYTKVKMSDIDEIINSHLIDGNVVERLLFFEPVVQEKVKTMHEMHFYKKQMRIALRNCGIIDPENIFEYIGRDGYFALNDVLTNKTQQEVCDIIKESGLRGRGGAGFPTGVKWEATMRSEGEQKYIICNADEGDPGAFMDRSILEGDPHSILESMMIAGYAVGADTGYIYIRAEYPLAIHRLKVAIKQAQELKLIGNNIFGTDFNFNIELKYGAGAFVCGEETALIRSIEGKRGEPFNKTYFPSQKGLHGMPTCTNNVETLSNIPIIIRKGSSFYNSIGTEKSKGTKVFALGGKIKNIGLVEVPMGTTLREIVYDIGGGIPNDKAFKAVQTGGPSGGVITKKDLDTPIDYESLTKIGSMMGSGGMIVLDETDCIVNIVKFYLEFTVEESCGKCTPCRIGNQRLLEIITRITEGKGTVDDLDLLRELSLGIKKSSLCGLGKTAPNPVLSSLDYFYDEFLSHVQEKRCPTGVCPDLVEIFITDKCIGCTKCARVCPVSCIRGNVKTLHVIDQSACIKCRQCIDACPVDAIIVR